MPSAVSLSDISHNRFLKKKLGQLPFKPNMGLSRDEDTILSLRIRLVLSLKSTHKQKQKI